jgi:XTP/dITP diphosphohydrolase
MAYEAEKEKFGQLLEIMDQLRAGCPWDKCQTHETLRHLTIEETYELSDAILSNDMNGLKGELGDLMLHLVFYSKIASESKHFTILNVLDTIIEKLIVRHPHIFGDVKVLDAREVKDNWEKIKIQKEGKKSVLSGVPQSLPALVKAYRMQEKASGVGFDWEAPHQVWDKVREELEELRYEAENNSDLQLIEAEFGDLIFALVNFARFIKVNPEDALEKTNRKFRKRFMYLEEKTRERGLSLDNMSLAEMDVYWEEAKKLGY